MRGSNKRAFTLAEFIVVLAVLAVLGSLLAGAFKVGSQFYFAVSQKSSDLSAGTVVLDKLENLCYGLPRQAFTQLPSTTGHILMVHPMDSVGASGEAVYADNRVVLESTSKGLKWWEIGDQDRVLGSPFLDFPPGGSVPSRSRIILSEGWEFQSEFRDDKFPLVLTLKSSGTGSVHLQRTVSGYI